MKINVLTLLRPLLPYVCSYKASCASFVIFGIRALWRSVLSVRVPGFQKLQMIGRLNPDWYRMLYSCTHTITLAGASKG